MNLLIKRAKIIDPNSPHNGKKLDILIENGKIKSVRKNISSKTKTFQAANLHVSPGWFDMHVNFRDPGYEHKEDLLSGSRAAAFGGFTGVACMPGTNPPLHTKSEIEYIKNKELNPEDQLFPISPSSTNKYLKNLANKVFGDKESPAGEIYCNLTMYDFRHISCCYWLPRYKSESALKYRFGWKKSDKIHYYSELLGMKDTIQEEDLLDDITKTELEKRLTKTERQNVLLREKMNNMEGQMKGILELIDGMIRKVS